MGLTKKTLKELLVEVEEIALQAGKKLQRYEKKNQRLRVSSKESLGVVSEADEVSETFIIQRLNRLGEEFELEANFLAEEESYHRLGNDQETYRDFAKDQLCWVIDPLDGTNNFLAGFDYYCVCICLVEGKTPLLGVVYRPSSDECFTAIKGEGAWLKSLKENSKRKRLKLSPQKQKLGQALFSTGFSSEKGELFDREFELFRKMMEKTRAIRRMGSAALDLCYVSTGMFQGFWERGLCPWDTAAAGLICQESGATLSNYIGESFHPFQSTIVASHPSLYREVREVMKNFH